MKKSETQTELDTNIPSDVVKSRDGGSGKKLSYLETWYVIDRFNQILGQGNWGYQIAKLEKVFEGTIEQYSGEAFTTSYIAQVSLFATIEGRTVIFTEVGYGDGTDKKSKGKAHELATKEAVSDGLKRAAKNLGRSVGLALYDKTQEFVGTVVDSTTTSSGLAQPNGKGNYDIGKQSVDVTLPAAGIKENGKSVTKEAVAQIFKALESQGKVTKDSFKTKYLGGVGLSTLPEDKLKGVLKTLEQDFPSNGAGR